MAKVTIRLYKVPAEFSKQAHDVEYVCQDLHLRVADGATIQHEEIGSIGSQQDVIKPGDDFSIALCVDCAHGEKDVRFEIVTWPVKIKEFALFKDVTKK